MKIFFYKLCRETFEYCSPCLLQFVSVTPTSRRPTSVMAPVYYTEICKQLEGCYKLESITPEKVADLEDVATHVRYYIPLTSEEYAYMLEDTTKVQLLEHMFQLQCLPNIEDGNFRTMDYVRGSTSALESYKSMSALELQQMVEDWRKTYTEV